MGVSGMWVIGGMDEKHVTELAPRFHSVVATHAARPDRQAAWRAWCDGQALVPGLFPDTRPGYANMVAPHTAVAAFHALAGDMPWDDPGAEDLDVLRGDIYDDGVKGFCVVVRKGSPVAALFHGIGPARAQLLPGWFGNFLLAPDEVMALRSQVEGALAIPVGERSVVLERVRDWLNGMGDSGDEDAEDLLDGPLRCFREAAGGGLGLCGSQTWV